MLGGKVSDAKGNPCVAGILYIKPFISTNKNFDHIQMASLTNKVFIS